jgi:hypothetical protein
VARTGSPDALAATSHAGWWIVAGCGALVLALGLASTSRPALASAAALGDLESA